MTAALADLQAMFQDRLLGRPADIDGHLANGGAFMSVYDKAYLLRLMEVMGEDFPGVHTLLGDARFAEAAAQYLRATPSTEPSIRWIGRGFAEWLGETLPWSDQPVLADMAAFEWLLGLAFDAPDAAALGRGALTSVPPEAWPRLRFAFHPALATAELGSDVAPFHRAVSDDRAPEAVPQALDGPVVWAAWRSPETLQVRYRELAADEAAGLDALRGGGDFADLCEAIAETGGVPDAAAPRAAELLGQWIDSGWIAGVDADIMSLADSPG